MCDLGVGSHECIELSKAHAIAVDFAKTGVSAEIPSCIPEIKTMKYPHYMQKPWQISYEANTIKGKLYDNVKIPSKYWHDLQFKKTYGFQLITSVTQANKQTNKKQNTKT